MIATLCIAIVWIPAVVYAVALARAMSKAAPRP